MAVEMTMLDIELTKEEYVQQACNSEKSKDKGNKGRESKTAPSVLSMADANYECATKALEDAKLPITTEGEKAFVTSSPIRLGNHGRRS